MSLTAVDLFAGLGGTTSGLSMAGYDVLLAANHWSFAVETHALNHPKTEHRLQDLKQADFASWPDFDLGWASPSCQGHSQAAQPARKASGKVQRTHDLLRSTAWAVVDMAEVKRPLFLVVENVDDVRRWTLYPIWKMALEALGYHLTENVLTASRWGVPQRRKRLFVVGSLTGPITLEDPRVPEPAFGPCIDWSLGRWRPVESLQDGPRRRIARARERGLGARFVVQNVTGHRGIPLSEPIRTITGADQWAVVDGDRYRTLTERENLRAMSFPESYRLPEQRRRGDVILGLGNAVPPLLAKGIGQRLMAEA